MHEARGLFCKTAISGILDKIAGREKKHDRAETGQAQQRKKNRGGGAGGRLTLGLGPSAERGRRIWLRKLGRRPSEAGPRGERLGRPTRARSTEGAGLDAEARASWAWARSAFVSGSMPKQRRSSGQRVRRGPRLLVRCQVKQRAERHPACSFAVWPSPGRSRTAGTRGGAAGVMRIHVQKRERGARLLLLLATWRPRLLLIRCSGEKGGRRGGCSCADPKGGDEDERRPWQLGSL